MWRLLAGTLSGALLVIGLNVLLLLFTPVGGIPLEAAEPGSIYAVLSVLAFLVWLAGAFGATVLACRVAGSLEGLVSIGSALLGTSALVGLSPILLNSIVAAYLQLGSIIMSLPLLFVAFSGGIVVFFARRPDMV